MNDPYQRYGQISADSHSKHPRIENGPAGGAINALRFYSDDARLKALMLDSFPTLSGALGIGTFVGRS